jgi:hypothetical protein
MTRDPILAAISLPAGTDGYRVPLTFRVEGGLHYMRGNHAPYFSLTYTQHRKGFPNQCYSGGAGHEEILKRFPRFSDLAALHLSDIDGVPMHAEANGWYWLAGSIGGAGEQYHGGNSSPRKSEAECLQVFADHCRITLNEAHAIRARVIAAGEDGRDVWRREMEGMRARWKQEAEQAIARHHLKVYGDPWPNEDTD